MRFLALVLLLVVGPALAQDRDAATRELLEKADQLEQQAVKALESGRKGQALELLTKAADLREEARALGAKRRMTAAEAKRRDEAELKARKAKAEAKARAERARAEAERVRKRKAEPERKPGAAGLEAMDLALEKGDLKAATEAGRAVQRELAQWQKRLEKRERELRRSGPRGPAGVEKRVAALEKQVAALRRMLESGR